MIGNMKKTAFLFFAMSFSMTALARIGETPAQCSARYGAGITNIVGSGDVLGFSEYCKDGINVVAVFNRKYRQAFFVMYSRGSLRTSRSSHSSVEPLKENEIASLLASMPNSWDDPQANITTAKKGFSHIETFAQPKSAKEGKKMLPLKRTPKASDTPTPLEKNLQEARSALEKALPALTLERVTFDFNPDYVGWRSLSARGYGVLEFSSVAIETYKRNGSHVFAFKLMESSGKRCVGLVFFDAEYAQELSSWAETHIKTSKAVKKAEDKGEALQGF